MESTAQYEELKGFKQILFALGHIGPGMLNQFITIWLLIFLAPIDGSVILKSSLVGTALLCGRIIDAIADPIVAQWSDRLVSRRWGRRIPFMVIGTIPMVISFNLLWITPMLPAVTLLRFIWVLVWVNLFYFSYTVVVNPYFALLPEITEKKEQRMFIQSFVSLFGILGMGIAMGASGFLIEAMGETGAGLVLSAFAVLVLVAPVLAIRTNPDYSDKLEIHPKTNIFKNIADALRMPMFRNYITGFATFFLGFQLIQYNLAFITTVLLGLDRGMSSLLFITSVVAALAFIPVYNLIVNRTSPTRGLEIAIFSFVLIAAILAFTNALTGFIPARLLGFILMGLLGFPYSGLMVIPNVLISEIIDEDFREHKVRREALFFGVQGLINKFMVSIASFLVGLLLDIFGRTPEQPFGVIAVLPLGAVVALVGFLIIRHMNRKLK